MRLAKHLMSSAASKKEDLRMPKKEAEQSTQRLSVEKER